MKLAQLMQNDEFMSQLQSNPEYRDALAQGAGNTVLTNLCSPYHIDAQAGITQPTSAPGSALPSVQEGSQASKVLKNMMRKFTFKGKSSKTPKVSVTAAPSSATIPLHRRHLGTLRISTRRPGPISARLFARQGSSPASLRTCQATLCPFYPSPMSRLILSARSTTRQTQRPMWVTAISYCLFLNC